MSTQLWDQTFSILESGLDLEAKDVQWCMKQILEGQADIELIKKFLLALKTKGKLAKKLAHWLPRCMSTRLLYP
jgi:anthranilate phosphoribosyltransferase